MPTPPDADGWITFDPVEYRTYNARTGTGGPEAVRGTFGGASGTETTPDDADLRRSEYMKRAWNAALGGDFLRDGVASPETTVKQTEFHFVFSLSGPRRPFSWTFVATAGVRNGWTQPGFVYPNPYTVLGVPYEGPFDGPRWEWENNIWSVVGATVEYKVGLTVNSTNAYDITATGRMRITGDHTILDEMPGSPQPKPIRLPNIVTTMGASTAGSAKVDSPFGLLGHGEDIKTGTYNAFSLLPITTSANPADFRLGFTFAVEDAEFVAPVAGAENSGSAVGVESVIGWEYAENGYLVVVYTLRPPRGRWKVPPEKGRLKVNVQTDDDPAWKFAIPKPGENGGYGALKVKVNDSWVRIPRGSKKFRVDKNHGEGNPDWKNAK